MEQNKIIEAEMTLRRQALSIYRKVDFNKAEDKPLIKEAEKLVDLADYLKQSTTYVSLNQFLVQLNKVNTIPEAELQELYKKDIVISFNNSTVKIPFDAVSYNAIQSAIKNILEEQ